MPARAAATLRGPVRLRGGLGPDRARRGADPLPPPGQWQGVKHGEWLECPDEQLSKHQSMMAVLILLVTTIVPLHCHTCWQDSVGVDINSLVCFQEVKVQVISAEKCQSWFKQAHR